MNVLSGLFGKQWIWEYFTIVHVLFTHLSSDSILLVWDFKDFRGETGVGK